MQQEWKVGLQGDARKPETTHRFSTGSGQAPHSGPNGEVSEWTPAFAGAWFCTSGEERFLALHETVSERMLTAVAAGYGDYVGEYVFFPLALCAPAFFELLHSFPEAERFLISRASLYAMLHDYFAPYVQFYNEIRSPGAPIPDSKLGAQGFLSREARQGF